MAIILYDKGGEAIAYIADDYHNTIFIWDGCPAAYIYEEKYIYGVNGRHLGWFVDEIVYNASGERIGFTARSCPIPIVKEPPKNKEYPMDEIRPRWAASPFPNLSQNFSHEELLELLRQGQVEPLGNKPSH